MLDDADVLTIDSEFKIRCNGGKFGPWERIKTELAVGAGYASTNTAKLQSLCYSCRKVNICSPRNNYGIRAFQCGKYIRRSGTVAVERRHGLSDSYIEINPPF